MTDVATPQSQEMEVVGAKPKEKHQHSVRISETLPLERRSRPPPLEQMMSGSSSLGPRTPSLKGGPTKDKGRKIGHRRVNEDGEVTYKKRPTSELMAAIQLGLGQSVGGLTSKPGRDLLLQDFSVVESVVYPSEGSNLTPAHHCSDFRFKTYAAIAFRYFRELFGIQPDDFLVSICNDPLQELSNPGASGSIFYITNDDEFIIKTVQHKEAEFLQKLLPGYYMNLNQNPRTLLPKFYGLYCYQCGGKNIRFIAMNNLLPSSIRIHEKYDLKGSTYKRKASKSERSKKSPTLKDLDFVNNHPEGIYLEADTYNALMKTMERDCRVLQSFKIMDYSLLVGVHNLDQANKERELNGGESPTGAITETDGQTQIQTPVSSRAPGSIKNQLSRGRSQKQRIANYATPLESIQAKADPVDTEDDIPTGGIPARNARGERLLIYMGIIDILQSYRLKKKLEHAMKAMVHDGDTISVHRPGFYAQRFQSFFAQTVFKKIPSPLKHSPSKKKGGVIRMKSISMSEPDPLKHGMDRTGSQLEEAGAVGGRPDLLPDQNIPAVSLEHLQHTAPHPNDQLDSKDMTNVHTERHVTHSTDGKILTETRSYSSARTSGDQYSLSSPVPSISESTPTHTEYTEDNSSHVIETEQIELHISERPIRTSLFPPSSPNRVVSASAVESGYSDAQQGSLSSSSSPTKVPGTSGETSYASALASQSVGSSLADDFMSPEEEVP